MSTRPLTQDDVINLVHRVSLLYQSFAETLADEFGKEEAKVLLRKAIDAYGTHIGTEARAKTAAKGLPLTPENFAGDLPPVGWVEVPETVDGETAIRVDFCPLAHDWRDMDQELARIYCYVDQAKMRAYNPEYAYLHLANKLDGAPCCRLAIRKEEG